MAGTANHGTTGGVGTEPAGMKPRPAESATPDQTGSGTANYITIWTGATTLGNSKLYQATSGNVGLGTATPTAKLEAITSSPTGIGVLGYDSSATGANFGVTGKTASTTGTGVFGEATATSGANFGVHGASASASGTGIYGSNTGGGLAGSFAGPVSISGNLTGDTLYVDNASNSTSAAVIQSYANSPNNSGVGGWNNSTAGGNGVYGASASASGAGIYGANTGGGLAGNFAGPVTITGGGLYVNNTSNATTSAAVIQGYAGSPNNAGVGGFNNSTAGGTGVYGVSASGGGFGIFGANTGGGLAGYFAGPVQISGNLNVTGTVSKGGGSFKIDHPLDPANKYLSHSFVESPDMMDVYNGMIRLDAKGEAWVTLPDYFEALNGDFRYQLTAIGAPAPRPYVAREVSQNRFKIAGGRPGRKVSWQVTGIRHDAYANAHRIPVTEDKPPAEQGTYLHPDAFPRSESRKSGAGLVAASAALPE